MNERRNKNKNKNKNNFSSMLLIVTICILIMTATVIILSIIKTEKKDDVENNPNTKNINVTSDENENINKFKSESKSKTDKDINGEFGDYESGMGYIYKNKVSRKYDLDDIRYRSNYANINKSGYHYGSDKYKFSPEVFREIKRDLEIYKENDFGELGDMFAYFYTFFKTNNRIEYDIDVTDFNGGKSYGIGVNVNPRIEMDIEFEDRGNGILSGGSINRSSAGYITSGEFKYSEETGSIIEWGGNNQKLKELGVSVDDACVDPDYKGEMNYRGTILPIEERKQYTKTLMKPFVSIMALNALGSGYELKSFDLNKLYEENKYMDKLIIKVNKEEFRGLFKDYLTKYKDIHQFKLRKFAYEDVFDDIFSNEDDYIRVFIVSNFTDEEDTFEVTIGTIRFIFRYDSTVMEDSRLDYDPTLLTDYNEIDFNNNRYLEGFGDFEK